MLLVKKMLRDMKKEWPQFVAIFLLAVMGIVVFSGITSFYIGFRDNSTKFLQQANHPDFFYTVSPRVDTAMYNNVKAIQGVKKVQRVATRDINKGNMTIRLTAMDSIEMLVPYLMQGQRFDNGSEGVWLSYYFAQHNNIKAGDSFTVGRHTLLVKGLILSSEHIYWAGGTANAPHREKLFCYAYVSGKTYRSIVGNLAYTHLNILIKDDADANQVEYDIIDTLGSNYRRHFNYQTLTSTEQIEDKIILLRKFSYILPVLFFLLGTLTMVTTMTRLIDRQRAQVGALMAFGYSRKSIKMHYLSYGLWIGIAGGVLGLVLGNIIIPSILIPLFSKYFRLPYWSAPISFAGVMSIVVLAALSVFGVHISIGKKLKGQPSVILKGGSTAVVRRSIFESIKPVWNRVSFETKATLRNMSRNRIRGAMAIIGVLSCTLIILTGLGMRNSLEYTADYVYGNILRYDYRISVNAQEMLITTDFPLSPDQYQEMAASSVVLNVDGVRSACSLNVFGDGDYVYLNGSNSINKQGLIVANETAKQLGVKVGDQVELIVFSYTPLTVTIAEIVDVPHKSTIYASKDYWESCGYMFTPDVILVGQVDIQTIVQHPVVSSYTSMQQHKTDVKEAYKTVDAVMYVMLVGAIILGVSMLVNLGLLNFAEMVRQYATLKVMGFYTKEIRKMAFVETLVLTFIGWVAGLVAGAFFLRFYMRLLQGSVSVYIAHLTLPSYLIATAITLICSLGVAYLLGRKIKNIDMIKSSKVTD